jgi:hypothetical protein
MARKWASGQHALAEATLSNFAVHGSSHVA